MADGDWTKAELADSDDEEEKDVVITESDQFVFSAVIAVHGERKVQQSKTPPFQEETAAFTWDGTRKIHWCGGFCAAASAAVNQGMKCPRGKRVCRADSSRSTPQGVRFRCPLCPQAHYSHAFLSRQAPRGVRPGSGRPDASHRSARHFKQDSSGKTPPGSRA